MPEFFFFFFESDRLSACPHRWPGGCTAWGKAEFAGCVQKSPDCRQAPSPPRALGSACPARLELVLVQGFLERKRRDRKMSVGELLSACSGAGRTRVSVSLAPEAACPPRIQKETAQAPGSLGLETLGLRGRVVGRAPSVSQETGKPSSSRTSPNTSTSLPPQLPAPAAGSSESPTLPVRAGAEEGPVWPPGSSSPSP